MKIMYLSILLLMSCTDQQPITQLQSTVDSNTINTGDSTPAILYLDDARQDTSFTVALDSMGTTVTATDTIRK